MRIDVDIRLESLAPRIYPGSRLVASRPLTGGVSAQITALVLEMPDGTSRKLVLRQYGEADIASNPNVAETEYRLLELLLESGIPVPVPRYVDSSGTLFPAPILVIDFVEGKPDFKPADLGDYLERLTGQLVRIHKVGAVIDDPTFLPRRTPTAPLLLRDRMLSVDKTLRPDDVEHLSNVLPPASLNLPTLLHGDYSPGNVLWLNGRIVAVIDWEDARFGDPLADVANCRLELLWAFGEGAMDQFTNRYRSLAPSTFDFAALPYWDLCVAAGPAANYASWTDDKALNERRRTRYQWYIRQALEELR